MLQLRGQLQRRGVDLFALGWQSGFSVLYSQSIEGMDKADRREFDVSLGLVVIEPDPLMLGKTPPVWWDADETVTWDGPAIT